MRKLRKIAIGLLLSAVIFVAGGLGLVMLFEDEVVAFAIEKIQSKLQSKMKVGELSLNVFRKFPKASIEISGVWIEDGITPGDTLLFAQNAYLAFNMLDLFSGEYTIDEVDLRNGSVRVLQIDGKDNFRFWKASEDTGSFRFDISELSLRNMQVVYENNSGPVKVAGWTERMDLSGGFDDQGYQISADATLRSDSICAGSLKGAKGEELKFISRIEGLSDGSRVSLNATSIQLRGGELRWDGDILLNEGLTRLAADIAVDDLDPNALKDVFPSLWPGFLKDYAINGSIDGSGRLEGFAGSGRRPRVSGKVLLNADRLIHSGSGESLKGLEATAEFAVEENGSWHMVIPEFQASFRNGSVELDGKLSDMGVPAYECGLNAEIELSDIKAFFGLDTLAQIDGDARLKGRFRGQLPGWKFNKGSFDLMEAEGSLVLDNGLIQLKGSRHLVSEINAEWLLNDRDAAIKRFSCEVAGNKMELDGFLRNIFPYLLSDDQDLSIQASLRSEEVNLDELLKKDPDAAEGAYLLRFPERVACNLNVELGSLSFSTFTAEDLSGVVKLQGGELLVNPASLKTSGGEVLAKLRIWPVGPGFFMMECSGNLSDVDVKQLFTSFGNFGQQFVTDMHLRGRVTSDLHFTAELKDNLDMDSRKVNGLIDVTIENGELIGLEALADISDYLRKNKLISSFVEVDEFDKKMRHVQFKTLHNEVEIRNGEIRFPKMEINSSAMDIEASGVHRFNNEIDYSVMFRIRDLLKKKESEFGVEEDDGLGTRFFLAMTGTTTNPQFSFDKDARKAQRKEDLEREKNELKDILKEEFRLFGKKDENRTDTGGRNSSNGGSTISVDWGEGEQDKPKEDTPKPDKPKEDEKKKKSWLEKLEDEEEETVPVPDDDDDF